MKESEKSDIEPRLIVMSRRKFLKLLAIGSGATILTVAGISDINSTKSDPIASPNDVPVRNPAFSEIPSEQANHIVLYCQPGKNEYIAYDLNPSAYLIWNKCVNHSEFVKGIQKTISQIKSEVGEQLDIGTVQDFVKLMYDKGLAYSGTRQNQAYFAYEEKH
jgi:hypothetical protein